jgi:hypothetical protein
MSPAVISLGEARDLALALPEAAEADHWGNPSFRVRGRIFATVPDAEHLNVMIDPLDVDGVVRDDPAACSELAWGKRVSGVQVNLNEASAELVGDLLEAAWRWKAPRRVSAARKREWRPGDADHKGTAGR